MCLPENLVARTVIGHGTLLVLQFMFAMYAVLSKAVFQSITVEVMLAARLISGTIQTVAVGCFEPECRALAAKPFWTVWQPRWLLVKILALGFLAMVVNTYLYLYGIRWTSPVIGSAMQCTVAVLTPLFAAIYGTERITAWKLVAVGLALCGDVLLLRIWRVQANDSTYVYGVLCLIGNVTSFSWFLVLSKQFYLSMPLFYPLKYYFVVGSIGISILSVTVGDYRSWTVFAGKIAMSPAGLAGLIYGIVVMGALPYVLNGVAFRCGMTAAMTALYGCSQPVMAAALSFALIPGTEVDWFQGGGMLLVVAAVATGSVGQYIAPANVTPPAESAPDVVEATADDAGDEAPAEVASAAHDGAATEHDTEREPFTDGGARPDVADADRRRTEEDDEGMPRTVSVSVGGGPEDVMLLRIPSSPVASSPAECSEGGPMWSTPATGA